MFRLLKHWFGFAEKDSAAVRERAAGDPIDPLDRLKRDCVRLTMDHEHSASAATARTFGLDGAVVATPSGELMPERRS